MATLVTSTGDERLAAHSLLNAAAVRERAGELFAAGLAGELAHFTIDLARLEPAAVLVAQLIRTKFPSLEVPFHARWRHFTIAGKNLWAACAASRRWNSQADQIRAAFDLVIVSVLLDAGAGASWRFFDQATGVMVGRSEGLAVASLRMFEAGLFSADPGNPLQVDASRLVSMSLNELAAGFQVTPTNPLVGLEGRVRMLNRLGDVLQADPIFVSAGQVRPGHLYDHLVVRAKNGKLAASSILEAVLIHLGPIWPGRLRLGGMPLGDTWRHPGIKRTDSTNGLVPFHKLSQWLAYSLIEPLQWAGIEVTDIDGLTGLAEYRNGGLFIDAGVLHLRDPAAGQKPHPVDSPLVIEWRALTIALLDRIAPLIRGQLGVSAEAFPLARVLEGGTWSAGRQLARERRADGSPPIQIVSDATVF